MPDMFLPPPGLHTQQMSQNPQELYFQKKPPAPSSSELAAMNAMGGQIIQEKDTLERAVDPRVVIGFSFLTSGAPGGPGAPPPAPPPPDTVRLGGANPIDAITQTSTTGVGNPWFDVNMLVSVLINFMEAFRSAMMTKLVDGIGEVKSMSLTTELSYQMYDTSKAIGKLKADIARTEATALVAQAAMLIASAVMSVATHIASVMKYPTPKKGPTTAAADTEGVPGATPNKTGTKGDMEATATGAPRTGPGATPGAPQGPKKVQFQESAPDSPLEPGGPQGKAKTGPTQQQQQQQQQQTNTDNTSKKDFDTKRQEQQALEGDDLKKRGNIKFEETKSNTAQKNQSQKSTQAEKDADTRQQEKLDNDTARAEKNQQDFFNRYQTAMFSPIFQAGGQIAQAIAKFENASREEKVEILNGLNSLLQGFMKNQQAIQSSQSEDRKAQSDQIEKLLSTIQQIIRENKKGFGFSPSGGG